MKGRCLTTNGEAARRRVAPCLGIWKPKWWTKPVPSDMDHQINELLNCCDRTSDSKLTHFPLAASLQPHAKAKLEGYMLFNMPGLREAVSTCLRRWFERETRAIKAKTLKHTETKFVCLTTQQNIRSFPSLSQCTKITCRQLPF